MSQHEHPDAGKNYLAEFLANIPRELDRFGLPVIPPFYESSDEKETREQRAIELIRDCFESARRNLPEVVLKSAWSDVAKRRRGHPKGPRNPEMDNALVKLYDELDAKKQYETASLPSSIGKLCASKYPGRYGNNPDTVEKRLRRLLAKRKPNGLMSLTNFAWPASSTVNAPVLQRDKKSAD